MAIFWNPDIASFVDSTGRVVPDSFVRDAVDALANQTKKDLLALANDFIRGSADLPTWATESEQLIRKALISTGQIAAGGKEQVTNSINGQIGAKVKFHIGKFRDFGNQLDNGEVSNAQLLNRVAMYADALYGMFAYIQQGVKGDAGFTECQNVLGGTEHSCEECLALTAKGFIPTEDMPPPGERICKNGCRCVLEYR